MRYLYKTSLSTDRLTVTIMYTQYTRHRWVVHGILATGGTQYTRNRWYTVYSPLVVHSTHHLAMASSTELVRAWPRWRLPVTLGGGITITNVPAGFGTLKSRCKETVTL